MAQIPTPKSERWYCRTAVLEAIPALAGLGLTLLLAARVFRQQEDWYEAASIGLLALAVAASGIVIAVRRFGDEQRAIALAEPPELKAHVRAIYSQISAHTPIELSDGYLRLTLHKVVWSKSGRSPQHLIQVLRYVGGRGAAHRRTFDSRSGIIGLTARTRDPHYASRGTSSDAEYRDSLVEQWGFTWDEAGERLNNRRAWMALPLLDERAERVIGVLYADSEDATFFDDERVREILWSGTQTLAEIVHEAYA